MDGGSYEWSGEPVRQGTQLLGLVAALRRGEVKAIDMKIHPLSCPICGQWMVREKVTAHMKRVLRAKAGRRVGVLAWRGAFCCHRIGMVAATYRLLDSMPGGQPDENTNQQRRTK